MRTGRPPLRGSFQVLRQVIQLVPPTPRRRSVISLCQMQRGKRFFSNYCADVSPGRSHLRATQDIWNASSTGWSSQARPREVLELVHGLEAYRSLIVGEAGAGHPAEEDSVFDKRVGVRLVTAHLAAQFEEFCGQVRERQRC